MEASTKTKKARYGSGTICKHITSTGVRSRAWVYLGLLADGRQNRPSRTFTALRDTQVWIWKMDAEASAETFSRALGSRRG